MPTARIPRFKPPTANEAASATNGIGRPMLFQVTRVGSLEPLWPYVLALHVNPTTLQEQFTKNKNVVMTRGGFVEFVWPDDLDSLSADATTGAFMGPDSGLTSDSANPTYRIRRGASTIREFRGRHGTIAWERHQDLLELFRSNGQIFNGVGVPVLRSQIMCMYDRGIYFGWFTTFDVTETGETPFQFKLTWEFRVTQTIYKLPAVVSEESSYGIVNPWDTPTPGNNQETRDNEAYGDLNMRPWETPGTRGFTISDLQNQPIANHLETLGNQPQPVDPEVQAALNPVQSPSPEPQQQSSTKSTK